MILLLKSEKIDNDEKDINIICESVKLIKTTLKHAKSSIFIFYDVVLMRLLLVYDVVLMRFFYTKIWKYPLDLRCLELKHY